MIDEEILDCVFCGSTKVGHEAFYLADGNQNIDFSYDNLQEIKCHPYPTLTLELYKILHQSQIKNIDINGRDGKIVLKNCNHCEKNSLYFGNELIYPIVPKGEGLPKEVPEHIRKDFDEARLIVNYSVRCAVALLRICMEHILHLLVDQRLPEKSKEIRDILRPHLKIERVKSYKIDGINSRVFDMLGILKDYGNDNSHSIRKIDDSDTIEAFNILSAFIITMSGTIISLKNQDETINQYHTLGRVTPSCP